MEKVKQVYDLFSSSDSKEMEQNENANNNNKLICFRTYMWVVCTIHIFFIFFHSFVSLFMLLLLDFVVAVFIYRLSVFCWALFCLCLEHYRTSSRLTALPSSLSYFEFVVFFFVVFVVVDVVILPFFLYIKCVYSVSYLRFCFLSFFRSFIPFWKLHT